MPNADTIIIGGGEIFGAVERRAKSGTLERFKNTVVWGIGVPQGPGAEERISFVSERVTHFSTRDYKWRSQFNFVPCASCLSLDFDNLPDPKRDVVVYLHRKKTEYQYFKETSHPVAWNNVSSMKEAIDFLASGETIVTNSYHGVYWGQLIGRKVLCIPYSKKFATLQDVPAIAMAAEWDKSLHFATAATSRLDEYRDINLRFMDRALNLED